MPYLRPYAAYSRDYLGSSDEGCFGYHTDWFCEKCNCCVREPEVVCTYKGSWEQPPEYEWYCRDCGSIYVEETGRLMFTAVKRRKITLKRRFRV